MNRNSKKLYESLKAIYGFAYALTECRGRRRFSGDIIAEVIEGVPRAYGMIILSMGLCGQLLKI